MKKKKSKKGRGERPSRLTRHRTRSLARRGTGFFLPPRRPAPTCALRRRTSGSARVQRRFNPGVYPVQARGLFREAPAMLCAALESRGASGPRPSQGRPLDDNPAPRVSGSPLYPISGKRAGYARGPGVQTHPHMPRERGFEPTTSRCRGGRFRPLGHGNGEETSALIGTLSELAS
ncbi:hypothetical protein MRX96_000826 [Rhipicephalus microplus]